MVQLVCKDCPKNEKRASPPFSLTLRLIFPFVALLLEARGKVDKTEDMGMKMRAKCQIQRVLEFQA